MNLTELEKSTTYESIWYVAQNGYPVTTELTDRITAECKLIEWKPTLAGLEVKHIENYHTGDIAEPK